MKVSSVHTWPAVVGLFLAAWPLQAADVILNEYSAVGTSDWLECDGLYCCCEDLPVCMGGSDAGAACSADADCPAAFGCSADGGMTFTGDACDAANGDADCAAVDVAWTCEEELPAGSCACDPACKEDVFFGRVEGNGGNWFELVVTVNRLDVRGWQLIWSENPSDSGTLTLTQDPIWSDLRAGTIITFAELDTAAGGLDTDTSFNPDAGDWWIHINTLSSSGTPNEQFVTTTTNVDGDGAGNFSVGNLNWTLTILDANGALVFGPCGEGIPLTGAGVNDNEVFKLEADPGPDVDCVTAEYHDGTSSSFGHPNIWSGGDIEQDFTCLRCNDGEFCNGEEVCDGGVCMAGVAPCASPDLCDEALDVCTNSGGGGGGGGPGPDPDPGDDEEEDQDGDGVPDGVDLCPDTDAAEVDEDGCSCDQLDGDDDGVDDCIDTCPGTEAEATVDADGCACDQLDSDDDGVDDCIDLCPGTAAGATVDADGCSCDQLDSDGDGVNDCDDECEETDPDDNVNEVGCSCGQIECDDGLFCNGMETCDQATATCISSAAPCDAGLFCIEDDDRCDECVADGDCDDGNACTVDRCEQGVCTAEEDDQVCADDGLFCNGEESCDPVDGCTSSGDPCDEDEVCDEESDTCTVTDDDAEQPVPDAQSGNANPRFCGVGALGAMGFVLLLLGTPWRARSRAG